MVRVGLIGVVTMVAALGSSEVAAEGADARYTAGRPPDFVRSVAPPRVPPPAAAPVRPAPTPFATAPGPVTTPTPSVVTPPDARPAPPPRAFFVPIKPAPIIETTSNDTGGEIAPSPYQLLRRDAHRGRNRDSQDGAGGSQPRENAAARRDWRQGDGKNRSPESHQAKPPITLGDKAAPTPTGGALAPAPVMAATAPAAAETPRPTETVAIPAAPRPRPGAPSATMLGVTLRDMVVNQLVAVVPVSGGGDLANDYGLAIDDETTIRSLGVRLVTFTVLRPRGLGDLIDTMGLDSRVQAAQPNFRYRTSAAAIAGAYPQNRMKIQPALGLASGAGVILALIDTRVADLSSLIGHVTERISVTQGGGKGRHGTALAGLIADVAPAARLLSIEAFADDPSDPDIGVATTLTLARALDAAIDRKADVINLSIAGPRDPLVGRLVRQALARGIVVVAAAGNDGPDAPPRYPAAYDGVVAVTATDPRDQPYAAGAQGAHVAVAAPGVEVRATVSEGVVGYVTGTSVAAAQVAGVAALLRERAPGLGSGDARRLLKETAVPLPEGPGMVDAFAALSRATTYVRR